MLGLKVNIKYTEKIKKALIEKNILTRSHLGKRDNNAFIFPILKKSKDILDIVPGSEYVDDVFDTADRNQSYKNFLKPRLTEEELSELPTSYDIIGDIIIIDIRDKKRSVEIGEALLKAHKNIKVILRKRGQHQGEFRTQPLSYVAGEKRKVTNYKENNITLRLDVEEVYFSPRLSTERKRIFTQVKKGEKILVMFSGCGPYPITISKNTEAEKIIAIEKNPVAHKYALINKEINKVNNVDFILSDVKNAVPKLDMVFDRILMPLPKDAEDFLTLALSVSKEKTIIHFYDFEHESEFKKGPEKIKLAAKAFGASVKILRTVKCGQYSPGKFRICVDFNVAFFEK